MTGANWISITVIALGLVSCRSMESERSRFPAQWWQPVAKEGAPGWEILPQEAAPGEVILSKRNELGILSNFAATPFTFEGQTYASVEGFWQMMKYPEGRDDERMKNPDVHWPHTREQVAGMTAFEAKHAGDEANSVMRELRMDWVTYAGRKLFYLEKSKGEFYRLIVQAEWAKLNQNALVRSILLKTGALRLRPDHKQDPDSPPAWRYNEIWMEIRNQISPTKD